ncbi:MAG: YdcF family protein [Patescibacteria group bacterium]
MNRWPRRITLIFVVFATTVMLATVGLGWFIAPRDELRRTDAIVVVSGGETESRAETGISLWHRGLAPRLVFSGAAADRGTSNARVMQQLAVESGVPPSATIIEEQSSTTKENAEFLKPTFEAQNIRSAILVTSPYHARRVKVTFEDTFGDEISFLTYPATDSRWARRSWWHHPDTIRLTLSEAGKTFYATFLD